VPKGGRGESRDRAPGAGESRDQAPGAGRGRSSIGGQDSGLTRGNRVWREVEHTACNEVGRRRWQPAPRGGWGWGGRGEAGRSARTGLGAEGARVLGVVRVREPHVAAIGTILRVA
jgi:hypothetical protein